MECQILCSGKNKKKKNKQTKKQTKKNNNNKKKNVMTLSSADLAMRVEKVKMLLTTAADDI